MRIALTAAAFLAVSPALAQTTGSAAGPAAAPVPSRGVLITIAPVGPPPVARHAWTPIVPAGDAMATLKASGRFTVLHRLIGRAGLKKDVAAPGVTLLAPSDTAFAAIPAEDLKALNRDRKALRALIARHIIPARIDSAQIRGATTPVATLDGQGMRFDVYRERLAFGDAVILQTDVAAANGLIHVIDKVQ